MEVQAPYGYVLDSTPVPFTVSEEQSGEDSGVTVITVEKEDMPQKGKILVSKTGEEFSSVRCPETVWWTKTGTLRKARIFTRLFMQ